MAQDVSVSDDGRVVVAGSTTGLWGGGNVSAGGDDFVAVVLGIDGGSYLDGGGSGTGSVPEVSGDSSAKDSSSNGPVWTLAVGLAVAAAVFGVLLVGLGWAWRKRKRARRPDADANATANEKVVGSKGGYGGGFDFGREDDDDDNDDDNGDDPDRCNRHPRRQQPRPQGAQDLSAEGVFGNPLFDHRNGGAIAVASAGGVESGSDGTGGGTSGKGRGLAAFPAVCTEDDVPRYKRAFL